MKQKQLLEIILPEAMADLPVRIVRGSEHKELVVGLTTLDAELAFNDNIIRRLCTFKDVSIKGKLYPTASRNLSLRNECQNFQSA